MLENRSDEIFRHKLQGHSSPVPEYMWQRVRPKKDKDRKMIFLWLGSLIVGLGSLVYFSRGHFTHGDLTGPLRSRNTNPVATPVSVSPASTRIASATGKPSGSPSVISRTRRPAPSPLTLSPMDRPSASPLTTSSTGGPLASTLNSSPSITSRTTTSRSIPVASFPVTRPKTRYQPYEPPLDDQLSSLQPVRRGTPSLLHALPRTITVPFSPSLSSVPSYPSARSSGPSAKTGKFPVALQKNKWWLDIYGSPDLPLNHISSPAAPGFAQYLERAQHMQFSYTLGLRLNRSFNPHFSGTIGFQYSRINVITISDTLAARGPEHLNGIDIPLLIGYRWENDYFQTTINSGIILNIYSWYKGQLFNVPDDSLYKRNTGVSLYLGLNLALQICN